MVMGYSGSMDAWEPAFVDALARSHQVFIFDNAGIGQTAPLPGTLTIDAMAGQTAALISALGLHRPAVLGWSMGGMIAQALAVEHPEDVGRLILCATLPGNSHATAPSSAAAAALANPGASNLSALLGLMFPPGHLAAEKAFIAGITTYPHLYLAPAAVDAAQLSAIVAWLAGSDPAGRRISSISVPTLVADGADDELVPEANDEELAKVIPHASLVIYPDAGHGFLFQDAPQVVARIDSFLS
jgi:pimeloyl-ACP methyl ester carboxylesterase